MCLQHFLANDAIYHWHNGVLFYQMKMTARFTPKLEQAHLSLIHKKVNKQAISTQNG